MLGVGSVVWYAIALSLPFMLWAARRVDTERHQLSRIVALSAVALVAAVAATAVLEYLVTYTDPARRPPFASYVTVALRQVVLPWIAIAAIVAFIEARRRSIRARIERERLRALVAEQRLVALTGQLHPHFLFNTLQGISTLIHRDPDAADEMLGKLSDLLRDVLRHRDQALVSLGDELRYARTYLEIARLRFADRLDFTIDVSPTLHDAAVPLFILQPLVENALGHGIGSRALGGNISVRAQRDENRLRLEVEDDGTGMANAAAKEGIGLSNTRERLRASFDSDQSLTLSPANGGGVVARIDIPYRPIASARVR